MLCKRISISATVREPWYLATSLTRAASAARWHEKRFRGKELFRDLKNQRHLDTLRSQQTERMERLVFGMVVLYYALTLIGAAVQQAGLHQKACKNMVALAFAAPRALFMPSLLPLERTPTHCTSRAGRPITQVGRNQPCLYLTTSGMSRLGAVPTTV